MKASGLIAGGALVALLLAGCGGDNSASVSSATTSGGTATTAGANSATKSGDTSSTSTASSTASSDNASTTTPSFKGNANSDFCTYVKQIANSDLASNLGEDPSKLKDDLQQPHDYDSDARVTRVIALDSRCQSLSSSASRCRPARVRE